MLPPLRRVMQIGWAEIKNMPPYELAAHLEHLSLVLDAEMVAADEPPTT